jgi:CRP-like cAMP-binding protein
MPADLTLLSEVPLFERLDDSEKQVLADQLDEMSFAAGSHIFNRGDPGGSIYIVSMGEVEIYLEDSTGSKIVFETAKRGDFFGELSLLDGDPRSASALAVQDTRILRVDRADLALLFKARPDAAMDILTVMGRRLREADQLLRVRPVSSPNEAVDEQSTWILKLADFVAAFSGTFTFLSLHVVWFTLWIMATLGKIPGVHPWDEYPFGFLTMVVSLEAIGLSCLVLISQSRQGAKEKIRSDVEYSANIRAGLEVTQLHVKIDALYDKILARLSTLEKGQATAAGAAALSTTATTAQPPPPQETSKR